MDITRQSLIDVLTALGFSIESEEAQLIFHFSNPDYSDDPETHRDFCIRLPLEAKPRDVARAIYKVGRTDGKDSLKAEIRKTLGVKDPWP